MGSLLQEYHSIYRTTKSKYCHASIIKLFPQNILKQLPVPTRDTSNAIGEAITATITFKKSRKSILRNWIRERKISPKFSDWSFFVDVRAACPCQNACFFSRTWRAWPKFLAGCPQGRPAENFLFGLIFCFWRVPPWLRKVIRQKLSFQVSPWLKFDGAPRCQDPM